MNEYNEIWTREKYVEYRKLKRSGYNQNMLMEHFGDDIYHSDMYNKNGARSILPFELFNMMNEIKITPLETEYEWNPRLSDYMKGKVDYLIHFESNNVKYIICLMYYPINGIETYNIVFTTDEQCKHYLSELNIYMKDGGLTKDRQDILSDIIDKETNYNDLFPIFKKISYILFNFYDKYINGSLLSLVDTIKNKKKINLYRNIVKNSFSDITKRIELVGDVKYYIYSRSS